MHQRKNQSQDRLDAPTCILQFYLPEMKQINIQLMFSQFHLACVRSIATKQPEDVIQGCSTTTPSSCTIAVFKVKVFVYIS